MSWTAVARKDVRDAARAKSVWLLTGLFLLLFVGLTYLTPRLVTDDEFVNYLGISAAVVAMFLPLVGIVLGYKAVIAERESGSIALLLSLPHSRRDVVIGKFVGRSIVLGVPTAVGLVVAAPLVAVRYASFAPLQYLGFSIATIVYGLTFLALSIALSTATTKSRRVTTAAFGAYIALVMFWAGIVDFLVRFLYRFQSSPLETPPGWATFVKLLDPRLAYSYVLSDVIGSDLDAPVDAFGEQWYTAPSMAVVVLLAWLVVPLALGYWRFDGTDL